ncbi:MAG: class I SAM-dependent methyltransferase, partial [Myxococcota bacterium]|nr:class I SAM-dependent methyltransferase [Myxococcota bacterium]
MPTASQRAALARLTARLAEGGASLAIRGAGLEPIAVGASPPRATVVFRDARGLQALERSDHLALAEAYLYGSIDVEGDLMEVVRVTDHLTLDADPWSRLRLALTLLLRNRERYDAESIAAHYDRPADFFTPWLDRWRCYSHGLYDSPDDSLEVAIERKMQRAVDALGLEPGMEVLDMGGGWGCFVEYAGLRGIRVQAITISREQHAFVQRLIDEKGLPCSVELVNFRRYRPERPFDGAVFMGTFEHNPEYRRAARWLAHHLKPGARVWADFCAQRSDFTIGRFMKRYIWPGPITYVSPQRLVDALLREGFNVHELADDTLSYACTVRDWGDRMEAHRATLEEGHGAATVRAFLLFLRGSE